MRKNINKVNSAKSSSLIKIFVGGFFFACTISVIIDYINGPEGLEDIIIGFVLLLGIGWIVLSGFRQSKLVSNTIKYCNIALNYEKQGKVSINTLANLTKNSEENVIKNFETILNKGYILGTYIDYSTREIVFSENSSKEVYSEYEKVVCSNCGGVNKVQKGKSTECEYCGSIINN